MHIVTSLSIHAVPVQNQIFLVKMKAPCLLILIVIQLSKIADCCSSDINTTVDNAFVSCSTYLSCTAKCYRGFIFPSGSTKGDYSCQDGVWIPMLSSCIRNPLVSVEYSVIWILSEVLPSKCDNISLQLDNMKELLEKTLDENCYSLNVNATVQFTYSFLAFQVKANFTAVYHNFTSLNILDVCIKYNVNTFQNLQVIKSMFEGVACGNLTPSIKIFENLHVLEKHSTCPNGTEFHNLTTSDKINYTQYCETTQIDMNTPESPTLRTDASFTGIDLNISQSTTLENEALSTNEISKISQSTTFNIKVSTNEENKIIQSTTLRTDISSTDQNSNMSQITTTAFSSEKDLDIQSVINIVAPAGGVFLIALIIISRVCLRKRVQNLENLTDDIKMKRETKHRKDDTSFKGEMIENELYKSADDVLDCDSKKTDNAKAASGDFSAAPYSKEKTEKQLTLDSEEYSYPCKISKCNEERLNVAFDDDTEDDLDVKARDIFQTPNHDSENACQYAVVNKSRKM